MKKEKKKMNQRRLAALLLALCFAISWSFSAMAAELEAVQTETGDSTDDTVSPLNVSSVVLLNGSGVIPETENHWVGTFNTAGSSGNGVLVCSFRYVDNHEGYVIVSTTAQKFQVLANGKGVIIRDILIVPGTNVVTIVPVDAGTALAFSVSLSV